jgi:hypothetical protein
MVRQRRSQALPIQHAATNASHESRSSSENTSRPAAADHARTVDGAGVLAPLEEYSNRLLLSTGLTATTRSASPL